MGVEMIVASLKIQHPTPLTGGHLPLSEMGILMLGEDKMMDISNFKFNHIKHNITQEWRKYFPNEPNHPISINTKKDIVAYTRTNLKLIASIGNSLAIIIERNIDYLILEVDKLKIKLTNVRQQNELLLIENQSVTSTSFNK